MSRYHCCEVVAVEFRKIVRRTPAQGHNHHTSHGVGGEVTGGCPRCILSKYNDSSNSTTHLADVADVQNWRLCQGWATRMVWLTLGLACGLYNLGAGRC